MTSQSPPRTQFADPAIVLSHFIRQIECQHLRTSTQEPVMLHFDSKAKGLVEYGWPIDAVTEERIPPSQLEAYRRSHEYRGPSCLCAFLEGSDYTEAEIGIVEVGGANREKESILNGEYVAICAKRRCGFFLCLERFYDLPHLREDVHRLRAKPLALDRLVYVSDVGKAYRRGDGLFQIMPDVVVRGRIGRLNSVDPEEFKTVKAKVVADLMLGVSEEVFWNTFVQCLGCKQVQFRQHYELNHRCLSSDIRPSNAAVTPRHHPYRRSPEQHHHRRAKFHAHLSTIIGDNPAQEPVRAMLHRRRPGNAATTESDSLDGYSSDYPLTDVSDGYSDCATTEGAAVQAFLSDDSLPTVSQLLFGSEVASPQARRTEGESTSPDCDHLAESESSGRSGSTTEDPFWSADFIAGIAGGDATGDSSGDGSDDASGAQASDYSEPGSNEDDEGQTSGVESSDDLGAPAARTSDMEKWPSAYDSMFGAISRINGPQ